MNAAVGQQPSRCRARGPAVIRAVLDATLDELARVGYVALTFEDVAARAGVNKTTVYRRWATKPELVRAALTAAAETAPVLVDPGDLRAALRAVARRARDVLSSSRGIGLLRMVLGGGLCPELEALATALRRQVEAPARQVLERAVARGELSPAADPGQLVEAISGWLLHVLLRERTTVDDERLDRFVEVLLEGAMSPAPPRGDLPRKSPPGRPAGPAGPGRAGAT